MSALISPPEEGSELRARLIETGVIRPNAGVALPLRQAHGPVLRLDARGRCLAAQRIRSPEPPSRYEREFLPRVAASESLHWEGRWQRRKV